MKNSFIIILIFVLSAGTYRASSQIYSEYLVAGLGQENFRVPTPNLLMHPNELVPLADSLHNSTWDTVSGAFLLKNRTFHTYDGGGLMLEALTKSLDKSGTNWQNYSRILYAYSGPYLSQETYQQWNNQAAEWRNIWRKQYTMNDQHQVSEYILLIYNTNTLTWDISTKYSYTYNTSGNPEQLLIQNFNSSISLWTNSERYTFSYSGSLIQSVLYEVWYISLSDWQPFSRVTYTYTGTNPTLLLTEKYDSESATWINYGKKEISYVASTSRRESETDYNWSGTEWKNQSKLLYTYENELLKTRTTQNWPEHLQAWRNLNLEESYFSLHDVQGIGEIPVQSAILPNPAKTGAVYRIQNLETNKLHSVQFSGNSGQLILQSTIFNGDVFSIPASVSPGIYFLRIHRNNVLVAYQKLMVVR